MPPARNKTKPVAFSGIQPTGKMHIGNYIGALSLWVENQDTYDNIFCVVDLHALSDPEAVRPDYLRAKVREFAALYLACGIDPERSVVFVQSHIPAHSELAWLLNCVTPVGWLERMTQYKVKAARRESVGMGLLDYPVLQAADILLYDTDLVPVGDDQRQHVELTRDIAQRFAALYTDTFVLPEALIRQSGARIMGLDSPDDKMSKSIGELRAGHSIGVVDPPDVIRQAIARAITDAGCETRFAHASAGVLNLLTIYQALSGDDRTTIEARFDGRGYGDLKRDVTDVVIEKMTPVRERYRELMADSAELDRILREGARRVAPIAEATLHRVREKMGCG
jgi:tryptophanyl-tRNA synthetase